jgi:hypothetical protein
LSETLQRIAAENGSASELPKYARKAQARLTRVFSDDESSSFSTKQKTLLGISGVLLLGSLAYHAVTFLKPPVLKPSEFTIQAPKGTIVSGDQSIGAVVSHDNRKISDSDVEKLRAEAEKQGKVLYQLSPTQYMFALPEVSHDATKNSKPEGSTP